jgi:DinB superfamily
VVSRDAGRVGLRAERNKLMATDAEGLAEAWATIEGIWSGTIARARRLPEPALHRQLNGEWSFVQTQRHLVLVTDCWLRRMVKGIAYPYHPWGLAGSWLTAPRRWGLDFDANPSLDEVLSLRRERMDEVSDVVAGVRAEDLARNCAPPNAPGHPKKSHTVLECLHVILKEEWQHHRYAVRDLDLLEEPPL